MKSESVLETLCFLFLGQSFHRLELHVTTPSIFAFSLIWSIYFELFPIYRHNEWPRLHHSIRSWHWSQGSSPCKTVYSITGTQMAPRPHPRLQMHGLLYTVYRKIFSTTTRLSKDIMQSLDPEQRPYIADRCQDAFRTVCNIMLGDRARSSNARHGFSRPAPSSQVSHISADDEYKVRCRFASEATLACSKAIQLCKIRLMVILSQRRRYLVVPCHQGLEAEAIEQAFGARPTVHPPAALGRLRMDVGRMRAGTIKEEPVWVLRAGVQQCTERIL